MENTIDGSLCGRYVIFLDIDGVLLPVPKFTFGGGELTGECVERLGQLITAMGGKDNVTIILSSTWRNFPEQIDRLNQFFEKHAAETVPKVGGGTDKSTVLVTKVDYYADDPSEQRLVRDRVDEIMRWLHVHIDDHPEAIGGRWIAIDDMKLDVDDRMKGHFLHTTTDIGMTEENVKEAIETITKLRSPEEAKEAAYKSLFDPEIKNEEINILQVLLDRKTEEADKYKASLEKTEETLAKLRETQKEQEKEMKEKDRRFEDVSYRLALYDFSKRYDTLREALEICEKMTGPERKEMNETIKTLVTHLRNKKELEKKAQKEMKKARQQEAA
ncbi:hypothetical protein AGDE_07666 [Angomonas deanei]|nr:hypothetical protein AGDE_07666 [Angomonas deanei]|eukprot:EPY34970.1 hypothetical protein AGDE_07666 [Angomonas deanei]